MASASPIVLAIALACFTGIIQAQIITNCATQGVVVTKTSLDSTAFSDIFWSNDSTVAFVLTFEGSLYRSTDSGKTWNIQQPYMNESLLSPITETGRTDHGVRYIIPNADHTVFYFLGYNGRLWRTQNLGMTYALLRPASEVVPDAFGIPKFYAHPFHPDRILAYTATKCCYQSRNACGGSICRLDIIASLNQGRTWTLVHSDTALVPSNDDPNFQPWGLFSNSDPKSYTQDYSLAFIAFTSGETGIVDVRLRSQSESNLIITTDLRNPLSYIISTTGYMSDYWHVAGPMMIIINNNGLLFTTDGARSLRTASFPPAPDAPSTPMSDDTSLPRPLITFVADDGALWAVTATPDGKIDLYADLDPTQTSQFTHILTAPVFSGSTFDVDLADVSLLTDGAVLIGNQYVARGDSRIVTKISWNRGAHWSYIDPPAGMCSPSDLASLYGCHLHFQGSATNGYIMTSYLAPGVILANGNVGPFLNISGDLMSFLSTDGGITWVVVNGTADTDDSRANYYALADNGGVLGFVDSIYSTNKLMYTLNFGEEWSNCYFDSASVNVNFLDSDPDSYFPALLMISATALSSVSSISHIDFAGLVNTPCNFPGDYQTFNLKGGFNSDCILGQKVTFTRRRPDVVCRIDENIAVATNTTPCACSRDDFVCDICFDAAGASSECSFDQSCSYLALSLAAPPSECNNTYIAPISGYDKLAGTHCVGGLNLGVGTRVLPCPAPHAPVTPVPPSANINIPGGVGGIIAGAIIGGIIGVAVIAFAIWGIYRLVQHRRGVHYERRELDEGDVELK